MYHQNPQELLRKIKKSYEDNTETSIDLEMLLDAALSVAPMLKRIPAET